MLAWAPEWGWTLAWSAAEDLLEPVAGQVLGHVDELAAAVVAMGRDSPRRTCSSARCPRPASRPGWCSSPRRSSPGRCAAGRSRRRWRPKLPGLGVQCSSFAASCEMESAGFLHSEKPLRRRPFSATAAGSSIGQYGRQSRSLRHCLANRNGFRRFAALCRPFFGDFCQP